MWRSSNRFSRRSAVASCTSETPAPAHTSKLVNQLICGLAIEAVGEGLTLAEKAGLDPTLVQQALAGGFADSKVLQLHGTRMIARDYTPGGKARTHLKDLRMVQALATDLDLTPPPHRRCCGTVRTARRAR